MSRTLEYQIKGKSDVEQVVGRAKASMGQLEKFTSTIGKKLGDFGKDFAMRFVAPMVILDRVFDYAQRKYEEHIQKQKEGLDLLAEGASKVASEEESAMAKFFKRKAATEAEQELIKKGREKMTFEFLMTEEGQKLKRQMNMGMSGGISEGNMASMPFVQQKALEAFLRSPEGQKFKGILDAEKKTIDKTTAPATSVSGNVIGVGQSPVINLMNEQNRLLDEIARNTRKDEAGAVPDPNLTNKAPSRAALLMGR